MTAPSPTRSALGPVLVIGGTDPLCGAGVFADALHAAALGAHPLAVITHLVDQDSRGVRGFVATDRQALTAALHAALEDGHPRAAKVGMLGDAATAEIVFGALAHVDIPVVVDPVLAGGTADRPALATADLLAVLRTFRGAQVVWTPNAHELGALLDAVSPTTPAELEAAALRCAGVLDAAVLAKAGHIEPPGQDLWVVGGVSRALPQQPGWPSDDVHGTGCALSTALAVGLSRGLEGAEAATEARRWLLGRVHAARRVGAGRRQLVAV